MDFLGIVSFLGAVSKPTGLWANILNWLEGGVGNYVIALIILTFCIKILLLPLDFFNKVLSKKNTRQQRALQPEVDKIKKRYANNPQMVNQKTMELYKRENYNIYGTCVGMIVYMALTLTIFFTLFSTLNGMSAYKIKQEFDVLNAEYASVYEVTEGSEEDKITAAEQAVIKKYPDTKTGFLWIKNIWRPDTSTKVTLTYSKFLKDTKQKTEDISEENYNKVMAPIQKEYDGWNGYYLLAILSGLTSFGTMYLSTLASKLRLKRKNMVFVKDVSSNKAMMIIMPCIMGFFTLLYNAAFGIYLIVGNIVSLISAPLISILVDIIDEKNVAKQQSKKKVSYSR